MLLHRDGIVGAAFHGGVVGDDEHFASRDAADAGDDACAGRIVVVHTPCRKGSDLEKRRAGVDKPFDALPNRKLSLVAVTLEVFLAAALAHPVKADSKLREEIRHPTVVLSVEPAVRLDLGGKRIHLVISP